MPSSSQTPVGTLPASILLVEEYKALAIAFGSALKQFAPGFATHVVSSLAKADALMDELKPALLVIDCDPPPLHSIQFFDRLRSRLPNVRVLIVAAENADELKDCQALQPALEFIKKPFELRKFSAVIGALLAPAPTESGTAQSLKLLDMILLYAITAAPIVLRVEAAGGRSGEIHFTEGRIIHAAVLGKTGVEAIETMLSWRAPRFSEGARALDAPRTIHGAWAPVLRRAIEAIPDETPAVEEPAASPVKREGPPSLPATKIVVVDDTDLLLVFVEEMLESAHPEFEIITAQSGFDGLKRAADEKPDLLLLDYDLPDITGADVCEKLLENEETARIPVIMMSGHVSEMTSVSERFENVVARIEKPFLSATLVGLVEQTLRELPKLRAPFAKKTKIPPAPVEVLAPPKDEPLPSRNGHSNSHKPHHSSSVAGLAEEHIPASILDPSPSTETEIEEATEASKASIKIVSSEPEVIVTSSRSSEICAGIPQARTNAVVLGIPLEVLAIDLSSQLRVMEIRARPFSSSVSLHAHPQSSSQHEKPFRLLQVQLNREDALDIIRIAPAPEAQDHQATRYQFTIDGVELLPAADANTVQLTPTSAPIRLELLGLFELARVELSPDFSVDHLVLKLRDKRMRATLLPQAIYIGATFTITTISLTSDGAIREVRLAACQQPT
ncbi:MAG: response regulator [Verrucomicrobiota bacterium]|nr:response regulator [Verrucomicrobiota bacterium]